MYDEMLRTSSHPLYLLGVVMVHCNPMSLEEIPNSLGTGLRHCRVTCTPLGSYSLIVATLSSGLADKDFTISANSSTEAVHIQFDIYHAAISALTDTQIFS